MSKLNAIHKLNGHILVVGITPYYHPLVTFLLIFNYKHQLDIKSMYNKKVYEENMEHIIIVRVENDG